MPPSLEPEHLFSPQQPPRRRWVWGVGLAIGAALISALIYLSASKSSLPSTIVPATAESSRATSAVEARATEEKSKNETHSSEQSLPDAVIASSAGLMRYELHTKLLTSTNALSSVAEEWQKTGTVPADAQMIIENARTAIELGVSQEFLPADVRQTVASLLNSVEIQNQLGSIKEKPASANLIASAANVLTGMTERLKAQSDAYYMSQIKDLMKRSLFPLGQKLDIASQYLNFNDPAISSYVARWLHDVQSGDTGSLTVSAEDKEKAAQLLMRIEEESI